MGTLPFSRCNATGKRNLFCFLSRIFKLFKCVTIMRKETITPVQQAGFSTLEMWLNRENKLFTEFFADKGETITNRKMLLDMQLILSLVVLLTFNFVNPLMTVICALWFGSAVLLVRKYEKSDQEGGSK